MAVYAECLSDSSAHGILQARILRWVAIPLSRRFSQPRDWTQVSCITGRFFIFWVTWKTLIKDTGSNQGLVLLVQHDSVYIQQIHREMETSFLMEPSWKLLNQNQISFLSSWMHGIPKLRWLLWIIVSIGSIYICFDLNLEVANCKWIDYVHFEYLHLQISVMSQVPLLNNSLCRGMYWKQLVKLTKRETQCCLVHLPSQTHFDTVYLSANNDIRRCWKEI